MGLDVIPLDVTPLDVTLGVGVALFLLVYMTYALLWPEKL